MPITGEQILSSLAQLSKVQTIKDVPQLTNALFPGTHCPLMGATMAVGGITDAAIMIIGTDECAYYNKSMTIGSAQYGGIANRCVSVVLDSHDVTFGSIAKVEAAFAELMAEAKPQGVFLVTTCVIEIIGDDYDALAESLTAKYHIPVLSVHTEHFKCEDHLPGLERTITACLALMTQQPPNKKVNVLGQRLGVFATTELAQMLAAAKVEIGLQLPSGCTFEDIRTAAGAQVNIVINDIALPLAQKMQEKFGTPYVYFNRFVDPEEIYQAYTALFNYLALPLPPLVTQKHEELQALIQTLRPTLKGVRYIYGNTPYTTFELNAFLTKLGMEPSLIQTNRFAEGDLTYAAKILAYCDPYICKAANIMPLQYVYDLLHSQLYLGHEFAERLKQKGIALVTSDQAHSMLGFEASVFLLRQLVKAVEQATEYRKELNL